MSNFLSMNTVKPNLYGWIPDRPSHRDFVQGPEMLGALMTGAPTSIVSARSADLRKYCGPVKNQSWTGACTGFMGTSACEWLQRRTGNGQNEFSPRHLYWITRALKGWTGDTGATIRSTVGAMRLIGLCPEVQCPWDENYLSEECLPFTLSLAANFKITAYYRLDTLDSLGSRILNVVKINLSAGNAVVCGFSLFTRFNTGGATIPYPQPDESLVGGHAVLLVGYNDEQQELLFQNSWGPDWGQGGFGWLPYDYVLNRLAADFWVITRADWVATKAF